MNKKLTIVLAILLIASTILTACGPKATRHRLKRQLLLQQNLSQPKRPQLRTPLFLWCLQNPDRL